MSWKKLYSKFCRNDGNGSFSSRVICGFVTTNDPSHITCYHKNTDYSHFKPKEIHSAPPLHCALTKSGTVWRGNKLFILAIFHARINKLFDYYYPLEAICGNQLTFNLNRKDPLAKIRSPVLCPPTIHHVHLSTTSVWFKNVTLEMWNSTI